MVANVRRKLRDLCQVRNWAISNISAVTPFGVFPNLLIPITCCVHIPFRMLKNNRLVLEFFGRSAAYFLKISYNLPTTTNFCAIPVLLFGTVTKSIIAAIFNIASSEITELVSPTCSSNPEYRSNLRIPYTEFTFI